MTEQERDEIREQLILLRAYIISHDIMMGECVAWNTLKERFAVGQKSKDDEEWMTRRTGRPFRYKHS